MIKENKQYSEEFATETFNAYLKDSVTEDCRELGFEPDFSNLNEIVLGRFLYGGKECSVTMDAVNAEVTVTAGKDSEVDVFAGLTDHFLFRIGRNGIETEAEYGYIFCDIYNHLIYGLGPWIMHAIAIANGSDEAEFNPIPYDEIEIMNPYIPD